MQTQKRDRPAFQSVELDPIDQRLEARAAEKGIPTLVSPPATGDPAMAPGKRGRGGDAGETTPRARMKTLNVEVPDYAWVAIKTRAAKEMVSLRHVIMSALRADGIEIQDVDMIEDGRRPRGGGAGG